MPQTKHTNNKLNTQSQNEDSSIVSKDGPSLEFLKSVEKSVKRIQPTVPPVFAKNEVIVAQKEKGNTMTKKQQAFRNILFSLRMFPTSQEKFLSMSLPMMARIFYVLNPQPHPPLKPHRLLLCPQLVVRDEEDQSKKVIDSAMNLHCE